VVGSGIAAGIHAHLQLNLDTARHADGGGGGGEAEVLQANGGDLVAWALRRWGKAEREVNSMQS